MDPIPVTPPGVDPGAFGDMAVTARDEVIAVWNGYPGSSSECGTYVAIETPEGGFASQRLSTVASYENAVATDGTGGAIVAWATQNDVYASYRAPGQTFDPAQNVGKGGGGLALAMNGRGDAALLFVRYNSTDHTRQMWGSFRPAGGSFLPPQQISDTIPSALHTRGSVAITNSGEVVFAWLGINTLGHTELQAAIRSPLGTLGPIQRLSDPQHVVTPPWGSLGLDVDHGGNAVLTWNEQESPEDQFGALWAARRPAGESFGKAFPLGGATYWSEGAPIAIAPEGRGVIAWTEYDGSKRVQAVSVDLRSGKFADPVPASSDSAAGHEPIALAVDAQGDSVIFFVYGREYDNDAGEIRAIRRNFAGEIETEQPIKCPRSNGWPVAAALDSTGRALLYWRREAMTSVNPFFLSQDDEASTGSPERCAAIRPSPNPALPGQTVTFDGSWAHTPDNDGSYAFWSWDLDWDGSFETVTGPNPIASRTHDTPGTHWVQMMVVWGDAFGCCGRKIFWESFVVQELSQTPTPPPPEESAPPPPGESAPVSDSSDGTQDHPLREEPVVKVANLGFSHDTATQCGAPIGVAARLVNDSSVDAEAARVELLPGSDVVIESGAASQLVSDGRLPAGEHSEAHKWTVKQLAPGRRKLTITGYAQAPGGAFYQYPHPVELSCERYPSELASRTAEAKRGTIVATGHVKPAQPGTKPGGEVEVVARRVGHDRRVHETARVRDDRSFTARLPACEPGDWKLRARYQGSTGYLPSGTSWRDTVNVSRKHARACVE